MGKLINCIRISFSSTGGCESRYMLDAQAVAHIRVCTISGEAAERGMAWANIRTGRCIDHGSTTSISDLFIGKVPEASVVRSSCPIVSKHIAWVCDEERSRGYIRLQHCVERASLHNQVFLYCVEHFRTAYKVNAVAEGVIANVTLNAKELNILQSDNSRQRIVDGTTAHIRVATVTRSQEVYWVPSQNPLLSYIP